MKNKLLIFKLILISLALSNSLAIRMLKRSQKRFKNPPARWLSRVLNYFDDAETYEVTKGQIGNGAFGVVFKASKDGSNYALKLIYIGDDEESQKKLTDAKKEVEMTKAASDSNFVIPVCHSEFLEDPFSLDPTFLIVFPLAANDLIADLKKPYMDEESKKTIIQMALAVRDLYENKIMHRDIKLENFLRMEDGRVMLTDFGTAVKAKDAKFANYKEGTTFFTPHDATISSDLEFKITRKRDVFALGINMIRYITPEFRSCLMKKEDCIMGPGNNFNPEENHKSDVFFSQLTTFYSIISKSEREVSEEQKKLEKFIFKRMVTKIKPKDFEGEGKFRTSIGKVVKKLKKIFPKEFEAVEEEYGHKPDYCNQKSPKEYSSSIDSY